jgi:hypothetical protein
MQDAHLCALGLRMLRMSRLHARGGSHLEVKCLRVSQIRGGVNDWAGRGEGGAEC